MWGMLLSSGCVKQDKTFQFNWENKCGCGVFGIKTVLSSNRKNKKKVCTNNRNLLYKSVELWKPGGPDAVSAAPAEVVYILTEYEIPTMAAWRERCSYPYTGVTGQAERARKERAVATKSPLLSLNVQNGFSSSKQIELLPWEWTVESASPQRGRPISLQHASTSQSLWNIPRPVPRVFYTLIY